MHKCSFRSHRSFPGRHLASTPGHLDSSHLRPVSSNLPQIDQRGHLRRHGVRHVLQRAAVPKFQLPDSCLGTSASSKSPSAASESQESRLAASTSGRQDLSSGTAHKVSRRSVAFRGAAIPLLTAGAWLASAAPGAALREVQLPDGSIVSAYELDMDLQVVALRGSVPADALADFRQVLSRYARFRHSQRPQLSGIFQELAQPSKKKNSAAGADAVTLGDAWLAPAIVQGLIRPIPDAHSSDWWAHLPARWRPLVQRNALGLADAAGPVWGVPYRWGCTLIAYRSDALLRRGGTPIADWGDLLQPRLAGRIAWADSPREFVGAALKTLGLGFNASVADLAAAGLTPRDVRARVEQLRRQVRMFSSRDHTRALGAKDVWAVVGWSGDLVPLAERAADVCLVAPASGVPLWADLWTVPAGAHNGSGMEGPSPLLPVWLDFWLQPSRAAWSRGLKSGASPLLLPNQRAPAGKHGMHVNTSSGGSSGTSSSGSSSSSGQLQGLTKAFGDLLPDEDVLERSEFLMPLEEATRRLYWDVLHPEQPVPAL